MAHPLAYRPTYSLPALSRYMKHISLPEAPTTSILHNRKQKDWSTSADALVSLKTLQKYQQAKIPFANLYLHYSRHHVGTLDPFQLYEYIVNSGGIASEGGVDGALMSGETMSAMDALRKDEGERLGKWRARGPSGGRGGSCTLNNGFFGTVMRSVGINVTSTGARVALSVNGGPKGRFAGWNHLVNLVEFEGKRHLVDVGFGGNGPTAPLELVDGMETPWGVTGDRLRLRYTTIDELSNPSSRVWLLQHKLESHDIWDDVYVFTETEFLPQDIEVMNWKTAGDTRRSFFNHMIICVKNILEGEDIVGTLVLTDGMLKRRIKGKNEVVWEGRSEVERWECLERWFGMTLGVEERVGIQGCVTELTGKWGN